MSATYLAEIVIQSNTNLVTLVMPGGLQAGDLTVAFVANKLDSAPVVKPAGWEPFPVTFAVVGTGSAGVDTGPLRISAFWTILTQATIANPAFVVTGGTVAMGYGQVWRKPAGESWRTPTVTFGTEATHDLTWGTTGSSDLGLTVGDALAVAQAGTANTGPTGRTVTVAGTTGTVTGINSAGSATGDGLFLWGERYVVATGASSGGPVSAGSHAANQSGGASFVRISTVSSPSSLSKFGASLTYHLNRKAGTLNGDLPTLSATGAANLWAGTSGMTVTGALNVKAGNTLPAYLELLGVLNQLAGTSGLGTQEAAASIP
jgi:hypothetical protein